MTQRDDVTRLLISAEIGAHTQGWDCTPPTLTLILTKTGALGQPVYQPIALKVPSPARDIASFRHGLIRHPALMRDMYSNGKIYAHLFVCEMWLREYDGLDHEGVRAQLDADLQGREFADVPGSIEGRAGLAVYGNEEFVALMRKRGEEPAVADDDYMFDGDIHQALLQLHRTVRVWQANGVRT